MSDINNAIVIADTHLGCQLALCPYTVHLDNGGTYRPSRYQKNVNECWDHFWNVWTPKVTRNEKYIIIHNGDVIDGRHHSTTTQISQNLKDQKNMAYEVLAPQVDKSEGIYIIRGTEAHAGPSAEAEEELAKSLGAIRDEIGNYTRYELFIEIGTCLVHCSHHIGVTSSMAYESTAPMKELSETFANASRWKEIPPDVVIRSHRHIHNEIRIPTANIYGYSVVTSGWQLKTPLVYRTPGGRIRPPTVGGSLVRQGDEEFFTRHQTWKLPRPRTEIPVIRRKNAES